ncbi:sensor histidine kinase [Glaciihabitans sp. dw_435]|uniref:sensor histidine kinase n=1 Tax=Glaciihabitans sp. dw_435 TaxID=2720081 RepID=UPI001BD2E339|nr:sensor histidine kinase [Glaciihabitans sp. dw_435]
MTAPARPRWQDRIRALESRAPLGPFPVIGWIVIITASVVLFWLSVPSFVAFYDLPIGSAFVLSTLQCLTLPFAVRLPRSAMLLHLITLIVIGYITRDSFDQFWPVPVPNLLALVVILVILGLRERWIVAILAWWLAFLAMTITVLVNTEDWTSVSEWGEDVLVSVTVTLIAVAVSVMIGQRQRVRAIVESAKRDVELEQAKRSVIEERARIARELHDVVAHSMSIVHIQAESARYRITDEAARTEFVEIARSARAALDEMRQLLGALRPDDESTLYAPQPTIADIPDLVHSTQKIGHHVAYTNEVKPGSTSPIVELTAYRIVQEALSNIVRHAPRATATVALQATSSGISIRVANETAPAPADARPSLNEQGGHGLRGMRERVALLGGDIVQEPLPGGGFLIEATLPTVAREGT